MIPLDFLELAKEELKFKASSIPYHIIEETDGGLTIELAFNSIDYLQRHLKIPVRFLLRISEFKATDFPKLFNKIRKLPWKNYLYSLNLEIKATAHESRMIHSDRISETCLHAIKDYGEHYPFKKKVIESTQRQTLFVRLDKDIVTLSLDLSGEPLYKRGEKIYTGLAPLRENICAGLLLLLHKFAPLGSTLYSPMCGSGTFLLENARFNQMPPTRDFSLMWLPQFSTPLTTKEEYSPLFAKTFGVEKDLSVLKQAEQNLAKINTQLVHSDIFDIQEDFSRQATTVAILNPPYGERIPLENRERFYQQVLNHLFKVNRCELVGIILPREVPPPNSYQVLAKLGFKNGGLPVTFYILK